MKAHPESNDEARIGAHSHSSLWGNGVAPVIRVSAFLECEEEWDCEVRRLGQVPWQFSSTVQFSSVQFNCSVQH
jgi:hypothetical protein